MAAEREYRLQYLDQGEIAGDLREEVIGYVRAFQPLEFDAAQKAKAWLETNVEARFLPHPVRLVYSEDESRLFGFFVVHPIEVQPPPRDVGVMQVRRVTDSEGKPSAPTILDPRAACQKALKLAWIARSIDSPADVGQQMFDYVVELGEDDGCCAIMVEPFNEATARRLWLDYYLFIEGEGDDAEWSSCLWYPLGAPNQTFN